MHYSGVKSATRRLNTSISEPSLSLVTTRQKLMRLKAKRQRDTLITCSKTITIWTVRMSLEVAQSRRASATRRLPKTTLDWQKKKSYWWMTKHSTRLFQSSITDHSGTEPWELISQNRHTMTGKTVNLKTSQSTSIVLSPWRSNTSSRSKTDLKCLPR